MTRIAFTADLHVDEYGSRRDPATGLNARLLDYLATTRFVAFEAVERGADVLVVAGDFTERRHPAPWLVSKIADALEESPERLVLLRGNHDGERAGGSIVSVLGGYGKTDDAFSRPGVSWVRRTAIAAIPYLDQHWLRAQPGFDAVPPADIYRVLAEQFLAIARGLYSEASSRPGVEGVVLVCHQSIGGAEMSDSQRAFMGDLSLVVDPGALAAIGFDGIVAGHLHRHQVVVPGDRPVLYAGSIERVDFGEQDETKGFVVADVGPGRFDWEFVETPARRYVTITDAATIGDALGIEGAIVRARFTDPDVDVDDVRRFLEERGAFEVTTVEAGRRATPEIVGGLSETLTAHEALETYFDGDPDREALVERGRRVLAEVG